MKAGNPCVRSLLPSWCRQFGSSDPDAARECLGARMKSMPYRRKVLRPSRPQVARVALGTRLAALHAVRVSIQRFDLHHGNWLVQKHPLPGHMAFEAHQSELGHEIPVVVPRAAGNKILRIAWPLQHALWVEGGMQQGEALAPAFTRINGVDAAAPAHPSTLRPRCERLGRREVDDRVLGRQRSSTDFGTRGGHGVPHGCRLMVGRGCTGRQKGDGAEQDDDVSRSMEGHRFDVTAAMQIASAVAGACRRGKCSISEG